MSTGYLELFEKWKAPPDALQAGLSLMKVLKLK